jgi:hypothetical protein
MLPHLQAPGSSRAALLVVRQPARPYTTAYTTSSRANAARPSRRVRQRSTPGEPEPELSGPEWVAAKRAGPKPCELNLGELNVRQKRRLLASAAARVEHTREYRRSLEALQELVASFRGALNETQRARWLAVEDALFEHASRVNEAYFWEGTRARLAVGTRHQRAAIAALADIVALLARR